jgi:hypothetical protein
MFESDWRGARKGPDCVQILTRYRSEKVQLREQAATVGFTNESDI